MTFEELLDKVNRAGWIVSFYQFDNGKELEYCECRLRPRGEWSCYAGSGKTPVEALQAAFDNRAPLADKPWEPSGKRTIPRYKPKPIQRYRGKDD